MECFICKECISEFPDDGFYYQKHRDKIRRSSRCKKCEDNIEILINAAIYLGVQS
jgi:hypothetical protein